MVPVVVVFWAPVTRTVSVSLAEVTCCAWLAAASRACRGVSGVLADPLPPDEQAARRNSAAADRPAAAARRGTGPRRRARTAGRQRPDTRNIGEREEGGEHPQPACRSCRLGGATRERQMPTQATRSWHE